MDVEADGAAAHRRRRAGTARFVVPLRAAFPLRFAAAAGFAALFPAAPFAPIPMKASS